MTEGGIKYTLAMIVRNCAEKLENCLESYGKLPDELVIVNTAATPDEAGYKETNAVAEKYGAKLYDFPWVHDFSAARNFAFSKASHRYVMWLDSDDLVENGELVDTNVRLALGDGKADALFMEYLYEFDEAGNCTTMLTRERVVDRELYEWRAPIHEVLCAKIGTKTTKMPAQIGRVIHQRSTADEEARMASLARNELVFRKQFDETGAVPELRMLFYWANTRLGLGDFSGAVQKYKEYLKRSAEEGNGNLAEQYTARWSMCEAYRQMNMWEESEKHAGEAILLCPRWPTAYLQMAYTKLNLGKIDDAIVYASLVDQYKANIEEEMVSNPKAVNGLAPLVMAKALAAKGEWGAVEKSLERCAPFYGGTNEFRDLFKRFSDTKSKHEQITAFVAVRNALLKENKHRAVHALCSCPPSAVDGTREASAFVAKVRPQMKPSVAFVCPDSGIDFQWGPWSIQDGIGGSEEAVINVAREFAKLGWHAEVYCNTGKSRAQSPVEDAGVLYYPIAEWTGKHDSNLDVAIWWRAPLLPQIIGTSAKANYLWLHDIFVPNTWNREAVNYFDGIFMLSRYHRELHGIVPEEKVIYTSNALDPNLFVPLDDLTNEPHRMIWGSDPSRGMQYVLPWWEEIRRAVPDAEIDVFYGWTQHFMHTVESGSKWHRDVYRQIEDQRRLPGVNWRGKVGQDVLARAFAASGIWGYPTTFPEIHCITALKAQAHGCQPIVTDDYALKETVQFGDKLPGPMADSLKQKAWVDRVIHAMQNPWSREQRLEMARWARSITWASVAANWQDLFVKRLESKGIKPRILTSSIPSST